MNPIDWVASTVKAINDLYRWSVKTGLRRRAEAAVRNVPTASVLRCGRVKVQWYERPATRELELEGHGTIRDGYYETWINVTPPVILQMMDVRR